MCCSTFRESFSTRFFLLALSPSPGRSPGFFPETSSSTSREVCVRANSSHSSSVLGLATRATSRILVQGTSPSLKAFSMAGSSSSWAARNIFLPGDFTPCR